VSHPDSLTAEQARDRALSHLSEAPGLLREVRELAEDLKALGRSATSPAKMEALRLTAANPTRTSDTSSASSSIALLNPTAITVFIGIGGARAAAGQDSPSCPPRSMIVLPVAALDVEVGVAAADVAAADAVVYLFRFDSVQPAFLGGV
jgi:hypothetical protein